MSETLKITDLHVATPEGKEILRGVNLELKRGEVHALMGPNGSGKSTLGYAIMGHPGYVVTQGSITLDGQDVLAMEPNERARAGIFLAFQRPMAIPGVAAGSIFTFSLTLGDYIIPTIIGDSSPFIGLAIYSYQGVAGNLPLAAAFSFIPIAVMAVYLTAARRFGAFEAL
mgnify:CR=1 FL=1